MRKKGAFRPRDVWILCLCFILYAVFVPPARGETSPSARPRVLGSTVCSARGTPLRGVPISTEGNEPGTFLMTSQEMAALTQQGLNALHIYVERQSFDQPVGAAAPNCDALVDLAEQHGLTVVLTVGEMRHEPEDFAKDAQFICDFWEFYAPRYADRPHVLYEICNEVPLVGEVARVQADAYQIIRKHAPDTLVLFYSLAVTEGLDFFLPFLHETERLIEEEDLWQNAALAFHGYESQEDLAGADHFRAVIHRLTRLGYPLINTELPNRFELSPYPDPALLRVCEEEGIAWLSFVFWDRAFSPSLWRGQLEAAGIAWQPDQGDWPIPDAVYPFASHRAWETAGGTPAGFAQQYRATAYVLGDGDYVDLHRLNFGTREPLAFTVTAKAVGEGALSLYSTSLEGPLLARIPVSDTAGEYADFTGPLTTAVSGLADVFFVYESSGGGQLYFRDWRFDLPRQADYTNPYGGPVSAANYPFRAGDIRREVNTDPVSQAPLQVAGITDGSSLLFDFVGFRGRDVNLHVRAKPLAGGVITLAARDGGSGYYPLGECRIDGPQGEWQEFTCLLDQSAVLMFDSVLQRWDLELAFSGEGSGVLFLLGDFWFTEID